MRRPTVHASMKNLRYVFAAALVAFVSAPGCAGNAYLPGDPGGAKSDLSGPDVRDQWLEAHPDTPSEIADAIREGVFMPGMTLEERDVITNPNRKGASGNGFWRSRTTGDEIRYQWFVSGQREPFVDGRKRSVCELVYVGSNLKEVRYCGSSAAGDTSG